MFYIKKSIKNSKNLKGLILRVNNQNISYYLSLIEDLKKLKILNIITNNDENEVNLLNNYPKLKERKYYFEEFKINEKNNIECIYNIKDLKKENKIMNYKKQNYKDTYLYKNEKEEVKKYIEIYLNDKKIEYKFKET